MKSLNAKRIAAIAASLAMGLVVAGPASFSSIPIINNAGQPVVQIVVGSTAQPSDGVVAANIAAVIGNLAYASTPITATVGNTGAVSCTVTTPTCTLSNSQVYLGEKGTVTASGSYTVKALIGSVLNGAALNYGTIGSTKTLQGTSSSNSGSYAYSEFNGGIGQWAVTGSPTATSGFAGVGAPLSVPTSVLANTNGGGVQFTSFSTNTNNDNILLLSNAQIPGLLSASGTYQESEYLWIAGFPIFNQQTSVNNFQLLDAEAAYQVVFGNPIKPWTNATNAGAGTVNHAAFTLLGQSYSLYSATPPASGSIPGSGNFVTGTSLSSGGAVQLAQAITPQQVVYVGKNISAGPWTVVLQDLSYPTSNGISNAAVAVYKNGVLTNTTSIAPSTTKIINVTGTKLYISVGTTFPGLYAYQKWAQLQLFSNVFNITSGKAFNTSSGKFYTTLHWSSNQTTGIGTFTGLGNANVVLQGIVLYSNQSSTTNLSPGGTMSITSSSPAWKVTFVGDSLGAPGSGNSNYDAVSLGTSTSSKVTYTNPFNNGAAAAATVAVQAYTFNSQVGGTNIFASNVATTTSNVINDTVVTGAANLFTVTSSIPTAFTVTSGDSAPAPTGAVSTLTYDLDTYQYQPMNSISSNGVANVIQGNFPNYGTWIQIPANAATILGNYISTSNPLTVTVTGYKTGATSQSSVTVSFTGFGTSQVVAGTLLANVTNVQLGTAIPSPGATVDVWATANTLTAGTANAISNSVLLGVLSYNGPFLQYTNAQYSYSIATNAIKATVAYTGEGSNVNFVISGASGAIGGRNQYYTYTMPTLPTPTSTVATATATTGNAIVVGITNSSTLLSSPQYWLNITAGNNNAAVYNSNTGSSQQSNIKAPVGFRTERGDELAALSTTSATYDIARSVDTLQFVVGPQSSTVSSTTTNYGPYKVGQSTNLANVTIASVNATCSFSSTSCKVTGLSNLTATPSATSAVTSVALNTATTPLAVLDSNANAASTLIVVGSKFVNSVAGQIFTQNPSLDSSFGSGSVIVQAFGTNRILVAGYTANQTVTAGNQFIQALLTS
ncbi:MAG: S-layer protein, partial [Candidatus Micrarchaeota archaeon]|nr:S-layer protein [Candidatus Micrarchaeota archaeon]